MEQLPLLYLITGIFSIGIGPLAGKLSDKIGKYKMFVVGSVISIVMVVIYCNLSITPLWIVILINVVLFAGIMARIIPSTALLTAIPDPQDRGAFMGINSSIQQISGGVAAAAAGLIVVQTESGRLERYDILGYVVVGAMLITMVMIYGLNQLVIKKDSATKI